MPYLSHRKISVRSDKHEVQDRRNNKWNRFYQNPRWKKLRSWYMSLNPLCVDCLFEGRSVPATELHHRKPFSTGKTDEEKFELLLDPDNLDPLCSYHHDLRHKLLNSSKT